MMAADFRPLPGFNDLGVSRNTTVSIEDNDQIPALVNMLEKRHAIYDTDDNFSFTHVRNKLEEVRREIEVSLGSLDNNRNISFRKRDRKKSLKLDIDTTQETFPKETFDGTQNVDDTGTYARRVQVGDHNMMLICEPKERERVYYKQVGDRNVMVNLTHSSHFYQLLMQAREMGKHTIFPLTSDGELWVEIKRRSQLFNSRGSSTSTSTTTSTVSSILSSSDNLDHPVHVPRSRDGMQHEDKSGEDHRRLADEHDDTSETLVLRNSNNFDQSAYSTIAIDDNNKDCLRMKFEIRHSEKGFDKSHMQQSILSHRKVKEFLLNEGNNFDMTICDWEYQRESQYTYIMDTDDERTVDENGYSTVPRPPPPDENDISEAVVPGQGVTHNIQSVSRGAICIGGTSQSDEEPNSSTPPVPPRIPHTPDRPPRDDRYDNPLEPRRPRVPVEQEDDSASITSSLSVSSTTPILPPRSPRIPNKGEMPFAFSLEPLLSSYKWYRGKINSTEAKQLLQNKPNGSFLVRAATGSGNEGGMTHEYTIEFVDDAANCKKLKIMKTKNKYHFKDFDSTKFEKLPKLIETIIDTGLEIQDDRTGHWKKFKVVPI